MVLWANHALPQLTDGADPQRAQASLMMFALLAVFVLSCFGPACFAGALVERRRWSDWVSIAVSFAIALFWPVVLIGAALYGALTVPFPPHDPAAHAPIFVLMGAIFIGAILFAIGLPVALLGANLGHKLGARPLKSFWEQPGKAGV